MNATRYTISMQDSIMSQIDQMAEADGMTRSGFLAAIARQEWAKRQKDSKKGPRRPQKA